ncbi:MAG: TIGR01458 family HAD-type hydrolase [Hyphomicrobiaceae bacterium]
MAISSRNLSGAKPAWSALSGVLVDLDGVVYQKGALIEGAAAALGRLDRAGMPYRFLTNTTSRPRAEILAELDRLGLAVDPAHVFTPAVAARAHLAAEGLDPFLLVAPALKADFSPAATEAGGRPAVVIADAGEDLGYANLNRAFRLIMAGAPLIALAGNRYFLDRDGELSLDVGAFVAALEFASGREALTLGKPAPGFFHAALADMGVQPGEAVMIGDDAEFDVSAAVAAGLAGILVRTGKYRPGAEEGLDPAPSAVADDLAAAVDLVLG